MVDPVTATAAATAPSWGPALIGGIGALGTAVAGGFTSALSVHESRQNRRFQRDMSNTAHQREVADLKAAGLNPILSAKYGGSSTPSGSVSSVQSPDVVGSAVSAASLGSNLRLQAAQARDINASAAIKEIQGRVAGRTEVEQIDMVRETLTKLQNDSDLSYTQREQIREQIRNLTQTMKLLKLDESHSALDLARARQESDFYQSFGGKVAPWLDHILGKLRLPSFKGRR